MRKVVVALLGVTGILCGCLEQSGTGVPDSTGGRKNELAIAMMNGNGTAYFNWHAERFSDNSGGSEKFADCRDYEVLTGFGARVSNGNITGILAKCRPIQADGTLGAVRDQLDGSSLIEKSVTATDGWVVVDVGGKVDGSSFTRALIKECQWVPQNRTVNPSTCRERSSDGNLSVELKYGAHIIMYYPSYLPYSVMTGVGMTAGYESLSAIRITIGRLKSVLNLSGISGGVNHYILPTSGSERVTTISISGGTGDADLYVGKGFIPDANNYSCRPYSSGNNETCTFDNVPGSGGVEYHIIIMPYTPYSGVTAKGEYFH